MDLNNNERFVKKTADTYSEGFLSGHYQSDPAKSMPPPPPYPSETLPSLTSNSAVEYVGQSVVQAASPRHSIQSGVFSQCSARPTTSIDLTCKSLVGCSQIMVQAETPAPPVCSDPHIVANANLHSHVPVN